MNGRLLEIRQVDGNLRQIASAQIHSHGLHVSQPAIRETDILPDAISDADIRSIQVDVVGNQKFARANHRSSGGRVKALLTNVRSAVRIPRDLFKQAFELPLSDTFKVRAFRSLRCGFVEIYRNAKPVPDFASNFLGQSNTILDGHAFDGNEGNNVRRAHARMCSGVLGQIDQLSSFTDAARRSLSNSLR